LEAEIFRTASKILEAISDLTCIFA
jgi:hypothetical protein